MGRGVLAVHQGAQTEARSAPLATVLMQLALNQDSVGTAGPLFLPPSWELGAEKILPQSSPTPMALTSCPVLPSAQGTSLGTSGVCFWNHGKALRLLLPKWKNIPAKPFPDAETPIVPG